MNVHKSVQISKQSTEAVCKNIGMCASRLINLKIFLKEKSRHFIETQVVMLTKNLYDQKVIDRWIIEIWIEILIGKLKVKWTIRGFVDK